VRSFLRTDTSEVDVFLVHLRCAEHSHIETSPIIYKINTLASGSHHLSKKRRGRKIVEKQNELVKRFSAFEDEKSRAQRRPPAGA